MAQTKLNPGFYYDGYDGERIVDANGIEVSIEKATGKPEPEETPASADAGTVAALFQEIESQKSEVKKITKERDDLKAENAGLKAQLTEAKKKPATA